MRFALAYEAGRLKQGVDAARKVLRSGGGSEVVEARGGGNGGKQAAESDRDFRQIGGLNLHGEDELLLLVPDNGVLGLEPSL